VGVPLFGDGPWKEVQKNMILPGTTILSPVDGCRRHVPCKGRNGAGFLLEIVSRNVLQAIVL
jgi:hypothetical protein